jgi:plastocyanin
MVPTGVASAPSVFAEATSKLPFYLAGGLLACWAVAVAALGIGRPAFPGSARSAGLLILGTVVLVAVTLTSAVLTGGEPAEGTAGALPTRADLTAPASGVPAYDTTRIELRAAADAIRFTNAATVPHNVTIEAGGKVIAASETIRKGATTLSVTLTPGAYVFFCSVDGHRVAGMRGTLTAR